MFVDYYEILDILPSATLEEIKLAFKKQAIKWHPDKNPSIDTTLQMQEINEAYLILKDHEGRIKYDIEYKKFKTFYKEKSDSRQSHDEKQKTDEGQSNSHSQKYYDYQFDDQILKKWMDNARKQAVDLAKQTIKEVKILSVDASKAAGSKMLEMFIGYFVSGIIILIIFKSCN